MTTPTPATGPATGPSTAPDTSGPPDRGGTGQRWEQRFEAARVSLPAWAVDRPARCVYLSNASGTFEVHAWDRDVVGAAGGSRQVTDRPNGTVDGAPSRDGAWIWWFADTDGDEYGTWRRQPFDGGADTDAVPGLAAAYSAGLAFGPAGEVVLGSADDAYGTRIHRMRPEPGSAQGDAGGDAGGALELIYEDEHSADVGALSHDGTLLAIDHSEHGDARHPAIRVLRLDSDPASPGGPAGPGGTGGTGGSPVTVGELWDGPGHSVGAIDFAPLPGDTRLLVRHERQGRDALLVWDVAAGTQHELQLDLPGELSADWLPDGTGLVVRAEHAARSTLHRYDLESGGLTPLPTPTGSIGSFAVRPDGEVWFGWSSAAEPPVVLSLPSRPAAETSAHASPPAVVLAAPGPSAPSSVPAEDVWVDGPGGRIHALLRRPRGGDGAPATGPLPVYVDVHGGPTSLDTDSFAAEPAAWVDAGYAVLSVNYRGSEGYGAQWRDALEADVGFTELADIAAVRDFLVADGVLDPARCVLGGGSWGGFLTLLGLGTMPDRWAAGVAAVPVADYPAAYEDEMEPLKAFDRSLFGGSPAEVPDAYRRASPLTWVDDVRAPVLVLAGANDPRCPLRQIENYLAALAARGLPHEVYRFDAGHGSVVVAERIRQVRVALDFADRQVGGRRS